MTNSELIMNILTNAPDGMSCQQICNSIIDTKHLVGTTAKYLSGSISSKLRKLVLDGKLKYSKLKTKRGGYIYQKL